MHFLKAIRIIRNLKFCFLTVVLVGSVIPSSAVLSGEKIFRLDTIHEIRLTFFQIGFWETMIANYDSLHDYDTLDKFMMMAHVQIDGIRTDSVGVKLKGNYTYSIPTGKKPMKIDFNAIVRGKRFEGLRALNLSNEFPDPSLLRNTVAYEVLRMAGLKVPRTSFARVYINNVYKGLYSVIEQIDKTYLSEHFPDDAGTLIKGVASSMFYLAEDTIAFWKNFEIKNKNSPESWSELIDFAKRINTTKAEFFEDSLSPIFDINSFISVFAADVIFNNWDSYFFGQNFYLYRDSTEKKYFYLAWDYNMSMNKQDDEKGDFHILPPGPHNYFFQLPLPVKIINNKNLKKRYLDELCRINNIMSSDSIEKFVLSMHNLLRTDLEKDKHKAMTMQQYEESLTKNISLSDTEFSGLLEFIHYRSKAIHSMLTKAGYKCTNDSKSSR